jgi:glycosyltransferase involved in cell wall biosynthesis
MEVFDPHRAGARLLVVATEWRSRHGGLSTFNRELCAALAQAGQQVVCLVPDADLEETADATARGVALLGAVDELGADGLVRLRRRPALNGVDPDVVVGHGRITGPAARSLQMDFFPDARRVHLVHTFPAHIEWFKDAGPSQTRMTKAADREAHERDIAREADLVAAVGPLLTREASAMLGRNVVELMPGVGPPLTRERLPATVRCLLSGRAEDVQLKGLDIAARAFRHFEAGMGPDRRLLVIQGAQIEDGDELAELLAELAGGRPKVHVAPYTADPNALAHELERASLIIMPSRQEGFGLVGLEAIAAGVPVLVSANSGLGELLAALGGPAAGCVVPVEDVADRDARRWADAIERVFADRRAAFVAADEVRAQVAERCAWSACAASLLSALNLVAEPPAPTSSTVVGLPERVRGFFGRRGLIEEVDDALGDPTSPAAVALSGRPGAGRGALALEAAWRRHQLYDLAWGVSGPPSAIDDALAHLAGAVGLIEDAHADGAAELAVLWLREHTRWLMLVDGHDTSARLAERLGGSLGGHLLVVGDMPASWRNGDVAVEVGPFTREESVGLLISRGGDQDLDGVHVLAEALGDRPLAVSTAAAYLDDGGYTVGQLLNRLRRSAPALFAADAGSATAVVEMLRLAHEELAMRPLASEALNVAAFMADAPIPSDLLVGDSFVTLGADARAQGDQPVGEAALGAAEGLGQLTRSHGDVRLNAEVAGRIRQELGDQAGGWAAQGVATVLAAMRTADGPGARGLVEHALVASEHAMAYAVGSDVIGLSAQVAALRLRAAELLAEAGEPAAADAALSAVADFLGDPFADEPVDAELIVSLLRARARFAVAQEHWEHAQTLESEALKAAHAASARPPVVAPASCELLLSVLDNPPPEGDPWYGALAFRALQASEEVLSTRKGSDTASLLVAAELRRRVAVHLVGRGQHADVVAVVEPLLTLEPQGDLAVVVAAAGELATRSLKALGIAATGGQAA